MEEVKIPLYWKTNAPGKLTWSEPIFRNREKEYYGDFNTLLYGKD